MKFKDFYTSWEFIRNHKISKHENDPWSNFPQCLDIDVVKVNPKTKSIDDNESLNTETNVWLEFCNETLESSGKYFVSTHWTELDCGAETFEKAIIKMANLIYKHYGDGNEK